MFRRILVPVDFSETSAGALDLAVRLAGQVGAEVLMLHVGAVPEYPLATLPPEAGTLSRTMLEMYEDLATRQREGLERLAHDRIPPGVQHRLRVREGYPPDEIVAEATDEACDLIVMGTHGRTGLSRVLIGSVTERVLRSSPVPVLVTR